MRILLVVGVLVVVGLSDAVQLRGALPEVSGCTAVDFEGVEGFLIGVFGTLVHDGKQTVGAAHFMKTMAEHNTAHALFSNAAAPPQDVVHALREYPYSFNLPVDAEKKILTSKRALLKVMLKTVKPGARLFAVSHSNEEPLVDSLYRCLQTTAEHKLFKSWRFVTTDDLDDARVWIKDAQDFPTYVVRSESAPLHKSKWSAKEERQEQIATALVNAGALHMVGAKHNRTLEEELAMRELEFNSWRDSPAFMASMDMHLGKGGLGSAEMVDQALHMLLRRRGAHVKPQNVVIIGDNLSTDMATAMRAGARSVFVLTGRHNLQDLLTWHPVKPTCYVPNLEYLAHILEDNPEILQGAACADALAEHALQGVEAFRRGSQHRIGQAEAGRVDITPITSFGGVGGCGGKCYSLDSDDAPTTNPTSTAAVEGLLPDGMDVEELVETAGDSVHDHLTRFAGLTADGRSDRTASKWRYNFDIDKNSGNAVIDLRDGSGEGDADADDDEDEEEEEDDGDLKQIERNMSRYMPAVLQDADRVLHNRGNSAKPAKAAGAGVVFNFNFNRYI